MTELPVLCELTPEALRARREGLLTELTRHAEGREDLPNGVRVRFQAADGLLDLIAKTIDAERQCCRFLRFNVAVEPNGGPIVLELTGPAGTHEFVRALLDA